MASFEYKTAYDTAKRELSEALLAQEVLAKKCVQLRKIIDSLAELCETEGIEIEHSQEAAYLLEKSTLADEIRTILRAVYPKAMRPLEIKQEMARLGHDLTRYPNPQSSIHMVLKRMAESKEAEELELPESGKKAYRLPSSGLMALSESESIDSIVCKIQEKQANAVRFITAQTVEGFNETMRGLNEATLGLNAEFLARVPKLIIDKGKK